MRKIARIFVRPGRSQENSGGENRILNYFNSRRELLEVNCIDIILEFNIHFHVINGIPAQNIDDILVFCSDKYRRSAAKEIDLYAIIIVQFIEILERRLNK